MKSLHRTSFMILTALILISSCVSAPPIVPIVTQESSSTVVVVATTETQLPTSGPTDTQTPTPTKTNTPFPTLTLTPGATFTLTPSPTPDTPISGIYKGGGCQTRSFDNNSNWRFTCGGDFRTCQSGSYKSRIKMVFCVISVTILKNSHMLFTVSWKLPGYNAVIKPSDKNSNSIFITDNLGNHIQPIRVGGIASQDFRFETDETQIGTFEFDTPTPGAIDFQFHNGVIVMENIRLTDPVYLYKDYYTNQQQFALGYYNIDWDELTDESGQPYLYNKEITNCTIKEHPAGELQSKLKDKKILGKISYDIHGFIDKEKNLGIREYMATSFKGIDPTNQPRFWVTIPMDNQQACILSVSHMLTSLYQVEPK
jgi:hypothetical protein